MKAWQHSKLGPITADTLKLAEAAVPACPKDHVLVQNVSTTVNPIDWKLIEVEAFAAGISAWPHVSGIDGAGVVTAVGEGVDSVKPGDKVVYLANTFVAHGAYAEQTAVHKNGVCKLPADIKPELFMQIGASPCGCWTAAEAVYDYLNVQAGEFVFINGGAGGVGCFAVQLAANLGAKVITTCSSAKTDFVKGLVSSGNVTIINYDKEDIAARVKEITGGHGCDKIFDTISDNEKAPKLIVDNAAFNARAALLLPVQLDIGVTAALFNKAVTTTFVFLGPSVAMDPVRSMKSINKANALLLSGAVKVPVTKTYNFFENGVPEAMAYNKTGRTAGKVLIEIAPELAKK